MLHLLQVLGQLQLMTLLIVFTQQQQLLELFKHSKALQTMHEMRGELTAIWERSHASSDQLLLQLRDWCARAEASGIRSLEEFSLRLRSYA